MIEALGFVFITVVGPQVEVNDDLHLLGKKFEHIALEQEIPDGSDVVEIELRTEMVEDVSAGGSVFAMLAERGDGGPVGARADEDLEDVVRVDFSVLAESEGERASESIDEEIKELVLVDFIVCLLFCGHISSKQTSPLTGFARY
ncbi:hypothetical protein GCM10008985_00280 [Halococcus dombrowskii]|uniref:Uncharacterized protein n=1 Tax=Halococcus dombrowskii TaxID=179637 RepID=A0AAV3SBJ2_HALDO